MSVITDTALGGAKLGSALAYVHSCGILHGDIKPANILLSDFDEPILTDFGIASVPNRPYRLHGLPAPFHPPIVRTGPALVDLRAEPATERYETYALAATLYFCVTGGAPPRAERSEGESVEPPPSIGSQAWDRFFARALNAPQVRFQTAAELEDAVRRLPSDDRLLLPTSPTEPAAPPTPLPFPADAFKDRDLHLRAG
ncbi:MAG: hypothetical protein AAF567_02155 [Actinomycetota bacterium]